MSLMDVFVKIGADTSGLEDGIQKSKGLASGLGSGLKTAMKVGAAAIGTATTAVGAFAMESVKSYASYEQLVGGVDKLYGDASQKLQGYAKEAYKTAGMSANEYMETATQFSASLINSLGGDVEKAADMTDVAMRAMSDNVNVFGSNFEDVSNAFKGFARENYTMLDNLKLGYSGSKEGMLALIADANEYRASIGESSDLTIDSFSDIITAIESVQEAQGIAGTTGKEAMRTIEGSAAATKAAWQNVVTAIAGGGDLGGAFDSLLTSIFGENEGEGLLNQVIPRVEATLSGIGDFIAQAAPYVTQKIPELIAAILPSAVSAGTSLLTTVGQTIINTVPALIGSIFDEIDSAMSNSSFGTAWEGLKTSVTTAIDGIKSSFGTLTEALSPITDAVGGVIDKFTEWIDSGDALNDSMTVFSEGITLIGEGVSLFLEGLASVVDMGVQFAEWLTSGSDGADVFVAALTGVATAIGLVTVATQAQAIAAGAYQIAMLAVQGATNLVAGAQAALNAVMAANPIGIIVVAIASLAAALLYLYNNNETVKNAIDTAWNAIKTTVTTVVTAIATFITTAWNTIKTTISTVLTTISTTITTVWTSITTTISTKLNNIKEKITSAFNTVKTTISSAITTVQTTIANGFSTAVTKVSTSLTTMKTTISSAFNGIKTTVSGLISSAITWGSDLIDNFVNGIKNSIGKVGDAISSVADTVKSLIGFSEPEKGPLSRFHTFAPDMLQLFAQGIDQNAHLVKEAITRNFDFYDDIVKAPELEKLMNNAYSATLDVDSVSSGNADKQEDIVNLLHEIADKDVTVVLDGDAKRLFKVMQYEARRNKQITGEASFV